MISDKTLLIIPARMASSRFPGKPLVKIKGIAMLERVIRIAWQVKHPVEIFIATDSPEIENFSKSLNVPVVMTSAGCKTGMDRAAEAQVKLEEKYTDVVTLQGDAVLTPPWVIDALIEELKRDASVRVATPVVKLSGEKLLEYLNFKKTGTTTGTTAVFDKNKNALYFSKTIIPHSRDYSKVDAVFRHIGLYAYRSDTLKELSNLPQSKFELIENLEQLRALENEIPVRVVEVDYKGRTHSSVDNPEDIKITEEIIQREGELFS